MVTTTVRKPTICLGSRGEDVKELQRLLNHYDYCLPVDGIFGAWTDGCVKDFQFTHFLKNDGIVGSKTWRALYTGAPVDMPILCLGCRQEEVKIVQTILANLIRDDTDFSAYYMGEIDGIFGPVTEKSVKEFQRLSGLIADGVVGDRTWYGLCKHGYLLYYTQCGC